MVDELISIIVPVYNVSTKTPKKPEEEPPISPDPYKPANHSTRF